MGIPKKIWRAGLSASLLLFTCFRAQAGDEQKIYGGTVGAPAWVVRVRYENPSTHDGAWCSGSLINSVTVLTARHCMRESNGAVREVKDLKVWVQDKEFINVGAIVEDPNQDVALMQLVSPVTLPAYGQVDTNPAIPYQRADGLLYGYGTENQEVDDTHRDDPARKKTATITFISKPGDGILYCQGRDGAARHGDSGGPVMFNNKIVGIQGYLINTATFNSEHTVFDAARTADVTNLLNTKIVPNAPTITGIYPAGDGKNVYITLRPGVVDRAHPAQKGYAFFYKWASDGDTWSHAQTVVVMRNNTSFIANLATWDPNNFNTLWGITVLPVDVTGKIAYTTQENKPLDGDQSNTTFLARVSLMSASSISPFLPEGWFTVAKENKSDFTCPMGQVMLGRTHEGDTTHKTAYRCAWLWVDNQLAVADPGSVVAMSAKESSGSWLECGQNMFMVGRKHTGNADGMTTNYCARFHFGTDTNRVVKYSASVDGASWSGSYKESEHVFECFQPEGTVAQGAPAQNTAMLGRTHQGGFGGITKYVCAVIPSQR